jgi:hypothetical protein
VHHVDKKLLAMLVLSLAGAGCSSTHETLSATTGVYDLSIASESDPCTPLRTTGPIGTAGVVSQGALLTLTAPDPTSIAPMLVSLNSAAGYAEERSDMLAPCTNATLARSYTIVSSNASGFDVAYRESWSGMSTCGAAMRSIMPAAPSADCSAELVMHYRLESACAAPCQVEVAIDGRAGCHC